MEIRFAAQKDVQSICRLYEQFFACNAIQQPEYYRDAAENGTYPVSSIESEYDDILIAVDEDAVIGMIHVKEENTPPYASIVPHRFAEVIDLFVEPSCRGKGVGECLIEAAKNWAKTRGLHYLELMVLDENESGTRFYDKVGFKTVSHNMRLTW